MTIDELIAAYTTDPVSPYHATRYATRQNYNALLRLLVKSLAETARKRPQP